MRKPAVMLALFFAIIFLGHSALACAEPNRSAGKKQKAFACAIGFELYLWGLTLDSPDPGEREKSEKSLETVAALVGIKWEPPLNQAKPDNPQATVEGYLSFTAKAMRDKPDQLQAFLVGCAVGRTYWLAAERRFTWNKISSEQKTEIKQALTDLAEYSKQAGLPSRYYLDDIAKIKKCLDEIRRNYQLRIIRNKLDHWWVSTTKFLAG